MLLVTVDKVDRVWRLGLGIRREGGAHEKSPLRADAGRSSQRQQAQNPRIKAPLALSHLSSATL